MNQSSRAWSVVLAGTGVNLCLGVLYTWSIFAKELTTKLKWSTTEATFPYTIAIVLFTLLMWPAGRLQDKLGGRIIATVGGLLVGAGFIVSSMYMTPTGVTIGFGLLFGAAMGVVYASTTPTALKWFPPSKKGLITGIVVSGFGGASVYASPLATYLLATYGIQQSFFMLGIGFLIIIVGLSQFLRVPPQDYVVAPSGNSTNSAASVAQLQYEGGQILKTPQFYALWAIFACTAVSGLMVIGHAAKIMALKGANWGFVLVAMIAVGNALGRPVAGAVSDKIGRMKTMFLTFALSAVMMGSLNFLDSPYLVAAAIVVVGFNYGASISLIPAATADFFGAKNLGTNYGIVFTGWGVGGVFGPMIAAYLVDLTGTYATAFVIAAVISAIAAGISWVTKPPKEQLAFQQAATSKAA